MTSIRLLAESDDDLVRWPGLQVYFSVIS